jgi:hypothetical protein
MTIRTPIRTLVSVALLSGAIYAARPAEALASSRGLGALPSPIVSQVVTGSAPTLRCTAQAWGAEDPNVRLVDMSCTVAGAADGEQAFRLGVTFGSSGAPGWTLDPFCIVQVNDGQGQCGRRLTQPVEAAAGRITVTGSLRPSGQALPTTVVAVQAPR